MRGGAKSSLSLSPPPDDVPVLRGEATTVGWKDCLWRSTLEGTKAEPGVEPGGLCTEVYRLMGLLGATIGGRAP